MFLNVIGMFVILFLCGSYMVYDITYVYMA